MKKRMKWYSKILDRILKGIVLFIFPIVLISYLLGKAIGFIQKMMTPIQEHLPQQKFFGIGMLTLLSVILILLICYGFGFLLEKSKTKFFMNKLDDLLSAIIPGYAMMKSSASNAIGITDKEWKVVLLGEEGDWRMGVEVDKQQGEFSVVFFPEPPDAKAGEVKLIHQSKLKYSELPMGQLLLMIKKYGEGAGKLVKDKD
ncbi:hypothetical protein [Namhaeicola litoreus]|uniref:DUF502 domain-containing protein n=1 Tax=Namhaeicola litoreus TaxID=1052145 RepID=A0ABW3Y1I1_9FLAO